MPRVMLRKAWADWRGADDPVALAELGVVHRRGVDQADARSAMERFCKPLAARFAVSAQAMRIRLEELGLLVKEIEPKLF